jgi:hypothetical protein
VVDCRVRWKMSPSNEPGSEASQEMTGKLILAFIIMLQTSLLPVMDRFVTRVTQKNFAGNIAAKFAVQLVKCQDWIDTEAVWLRPT